PPRYSDVLKEKVLALHKFIQKWNALEGEEARRLKEALDQKGPAADQTLVMKAMERKFGFIPLYQKYGRDIRSLIDKEIYPHQPHWGNMTVDISGNQPTIWHDLGGWSLAKDPDSPGEEMNAAQKFGYVYFVLYRAL